MAHTQTRMDRATFLSRTLGVFAVAFVDRSSIARLLPSRKGLDHPEPREGITAEHVLSIEALGKFAKKDKVGELYEAARTYPVLFDSVACGCSCGPHRGDHRSLLSCYETMQPTGCGGCQEEAEIVVRMAKESKPLSEIRAAVDKWAS